MDEDIFKKILKVQRKEITEHTIYKKLASRIKDANNKKVLLHLFKEELSHYFFWKKITKIEIKPNGVQTFFYDLLSRVFGLTFSLKLMEKGEELSRISYEKLVEIDPGKKNNPG